MAKIITKEEALDIIKDQDEIVLGMAGAEPQVMISILHLLKKQHKDVKITNCLPMISAPYISGTHQETLHIDSWFFGASLRKSFDEGHISFIPNHLHLAGKRRFETHPVDVYIGAASLPDQDGYISLSLSNVYEKLAITKAKISILEINPNMPRTYGDLIIHQDDIDYLIETNYMPPILEEQEPNENDIKIGQYIADLIDDGASLQLGIGGIPNAVAHALMDKKDLGIHTEMFTTGLMHLIKAGVVTGKYKHTHPNKHVCCFALGSQELYDFINNNPDVEIRDGNYVNDPYVIGLNPNQVSINTTIEIDLTGQCASESIGSRHFSGTGGQTDTAVGAQRSVNGKSFIALYSTAMVRVPGQDKRQMISKIVPMLKQGAAVTLSRNDVDYVVTEYGVAHLRGCSVKERALKLIQIAHPDFREELYEKAKAMYHIS